MRIFLGTDVVGLRALLADEPLRAEPIVAASEDEQDEFDAMQEAAQRGPVVVAAEVDSTDVPVSLREVEAFHVDADQSGDLAWYATQEIDTVIDLLV